MTFDRFRLYCHIRTGPEYPEKYSGFSLLDSLVNPGNNREKVKPNNDGLKKLSETIEGETKEIIGQINVDK